MLSKMKTFMAVAVLSGTVSANVHAATLTVKKGDTLWDLSRVHNTSVENIQKANHLTTDIIHPGDVLSFVPKSQYTVKQGDTLWDIAMDHHVSVPLIKEWNKLNTDLIHPGLNLIIDNGLNTTNTSLTDKQINPAVHSTADSNTTVAKATRILLPTVLASMSVVKTPKITAKATKKMVKAPKIAAKKPIIKAIAQKKTAPALKAASTDNTSSKVISVKATAYTASCTGCSGTTATGINIKANPEEKVIAVDPSVIPLGSKVYVEGFGNATAADTGGAIKGKRIDIFIPSEINAINFGVKNLKVTILN